ncbi:MAG: Holliday junction branch migration protein RuvA [Synergistaceae bacterium]|jgi:Holliday junction DNA helicase RuvA|nr:Holliday junction branch migration protein RuvA [Synergistaceae bacterium]
MLKRIRGRVLEKGETSVVLDVSGLGFEVFCSRRCDEMCPIGDEVEIEVVLHLPETGPVLFGFADGKERLLFRKITGTKGIGGKIALSLLRVLPLSELVQSIRQGDISRLSQVPGVGKKTAERLCFELKNKLDEFVETEEESSLAQANSIDVTSAVLEALLGLGFSRSEAVVSLSRAALNMSGSGTDLEEGRLLQAALRELQKN